MFRRISFILISNSRCMAGHSKWANIRHIKGAKDAEKSVITQRMMRQAKAAIRENGSADPSVNYKLAHVLEQARSHNIPSEKMQQVLKADSSKDDSRPGTLEIRGPGGSYFVVDILTNNITRTRNNISTILKKTNASFADGIRNHIFSHKGIIKVSPLNKNQTLDEVTELGIEIGAEDVKEEDGAFVFITEPNDFFTAKTAITKLGYTTIESNLMYLSVVKANLSEYDLELVSKLYDKVGEDPDVVKIHDNID